MEAKLNVNITWINKRQYLPWTQAKPLHPKHTHIQTTHLYAQEFIEMVSNFHILISICWNFSIKSNINKSVHHIGILEIVIPYLEFMYPPTVKL